MEPFLETAPIRILLLGAPRSRILIGAVSGNSSNKRLQICSLLLEPFLETAPIRILLLGAPRSRILIGAVSGNSSNKDSAFGRSQKQEVRSLRTKVDPVSGNIRALPEAGSLLEPFLETCGRSQKQDPYVFGNSSRNRCHS